MHDDLIAFISSESGFPEDRIHLNTKLEDDLDIYGDDAFDLLVAYSFKYNVDMSNFKFEDYFITEGSLYFFQKLLKIKRPSKLTVAHLAKGIIAGKLDESIIN